MSDDLIDGDDLAEPPRFVRFECTGVRIKHKSRLIGEVTRYYSDVLVPADALQGVAGRTGAGGRAIRPRRPVATPGRAQHPSDVLFTFPCRTCRVTVEWRIDRALRIVDAIIEKRLDVGQRFGQSGRVTVDLAALPATLR